MAKIYITYRKYDTTRSEIDRLANHLRRAFGDAIVMVSSGADEDVVEITRKVKGVDAVLLVIGEHWLDMVDERGKRLIDNRLDPHYNELVAALEDDSKWVSTILVDGAKMPDAEMLPRALQPITERDVIDLSKPKHVADQIDTLRRRLIEVGILEKPEVNFPKARKPKNEYVVPRRERTNPTMTDDDGNEVELTNDNIPEAEILNKVMIYSLIAIVVIALLFTPLLFFAGSRNSNEVLITPTEVPTDVPDIVIDTELVNNAIARAAQEAQTLPIAIPVADVDLLPTDSDLQPITVDNLAALQPLDLETNIRGTQVIFAPVLQQLITSERNTLYRYEIANLTNILEDRAEFDARRTILSIDFDITGDYVAVVTTSGADNDLNVVTLEEALNINSTNREEDDLFDAAYGDNYTYGTNGYNYRGAFIAKSRRSTLPEGIVGAAIMDYQGADFLQHQAIITTTGLVYLDGDSVPRYDGIAVEPAYVAATDALAIVYNGAIGLDSIRSDNNPFDALIYYGEDINEIAAHPFSPVMAVVLNGDMLNLRDIDADTDSLSLQFDAMITDVAFNSSGTLIAVALETGEVLLLGVKQS